MPRSTRPRPTPAVMQEIGRRLRLTRAAFELKQKEFAARAGIEQNTYNQFEKGKNRPSLDNALAIRAEYGVTLDWIYVGDPSGLPYHLRTQLKDLKQRPPEELADDDSPSE